MRREPPRILGWLAAALGVILMVIGICRGEPEVVITKAINLCLECIGIG